ESLVGVGRGQAIAARVKMSKNIKELREELQRQAKETLKLQEEATKLSVESMSHREGTLSPCNTASASIHLNSSPTQRSSSMPSSVVEASTVQNSTVASGSPPKFMYTKYEKLDVEGQRKTCSSGKQHIDTILEEYSQQVRELQRRLSDATECHEEQKFALRQTIIELQSTLREVQREKDSITDLRRRESQTQDNIAFQLKATINELQTANQLQEGVLKETNNQVEHLKRMIQGHEDVLQQLRNVLVSYEETSGKKVYEHESINNLHMCNLAPAFSKVIQDLESELLHLKGKVASLLQDKKDIQIRDLEACLSEMELDRVKLVNCSSERLRTIKEMQLEREGLMTEIKASRIEVAALVEESEALKKSYRDKTEEMDVAVTKLNMQLKSAQIELEQTRTTLKSVEGSDGHAMKVAMGMQKQITAKRGQIDALQSKIKFLEEAMTNSTKEKHYLKEERNRLSQELGSLASVNNKMAGELEILKSQDKRLKEKLATMEAALDKASMQFAECQCIMQRQEQEVMRFKLQHTLDAKELQGPGHTLSSPVKPRHSTSVCHSLSSSAPASQAFAGHHVNFLPARVSSSKEDPLRDLKHLLQELKTTIDEIPSTILPRRECDSDSDSILETPSTTLDLASRECIGQRSHEPYNSKVLVSIFKRLFLLYLTSQAIFSSTPRYSSSKTLSPEERFKDRSPVHSLLTAPLDDLKTVPGISLEQHRSSLKKSSPPETVTVTASTAAYRTTQMEEANGSTCRKLQNKMDNLQNLVETLQLKNQAMSSMIRCQEKKIEKAKEKEKKLSK
ncbi:hypothetical protein lerEdw1_002402, partial [Lerista edwardsae]